MKSYYTLEDCILNKKSDDFIFKQDKLKTREYSSGNLEEIKNFNKNMGVTYLNTLIIIKIFVYFLYTKLALL